MRDQRAIEVGATVRISDAVWGDVTEIIAASTGTPSCIVVRFSEKSDLIIPIEELPPQLLDA
ncbi:MAG: hypothetical protein ACK4Q4_00820 [Rhodocyclaceae bacterium]